MNIYLILNELQNKSLNQICQEQNLNYQKTYKIIKKQHPDILSVKKNGKYNKNIENARQRLKIKETPSIIKSLYYDNKLTLKQIGMKYNTTAATVLKYFRDNNIKRRSKSEITKELMKDPKRKELARIGSINAYLSRRKFSTGPELKFECWLNENNIKYETQYRKVGNGHPYDFFLLEYNLLVEIDGYYWHSKKEQKTKDNLHDTQALDCGYNILRICTKELKYKSYEEFLGDYIEFKKLK